MINPYPAELLTWNNPSSIFKTMHYHFIRDIKMKTWKLISQQYSTGQIARMCRLALLKTGDKG